MHDGMKVLLIFTFAVNICYVGAALLPPDGSNADQDDGFSITSNNGEEGGGFSITSNNGEQGAGFAVTSHNEDQGGDFSLTSNNGPEVPAVISHNPDDEEEDEDTELVFPMGDFSQCAGTLDMCTANYQNIHDPEETDKNEYYSCMMEATNCTAEELDTRNERVSEILVCYDMLNYCGDMQRNLSESFGMFEGFRIYFHCLLYSHDCSSHENVVKRQLLESVAIYCFECPPVDEVMPTPNPSVVPCYQALPICVTPISDGTANFEKMQEAYDCLEKLDYCTGAEETMRLQQMASLSQYTSGCYMQLLECMDMSEDIMTKSQEELKEQYDCIQALTGCREEEEELRANMTRSLMYICYVCRSEPDRGIDESTPSPSHSCHDHIMGCYGRFNRSSMVIPDMESLIACMYTRTDCSASDEAERQRIYDYVKPWCETCTTSRPLTSSSPSYSTMPHPSDVSCYDHLTECGMQMESGDMNLVMVYSCIMRPRNCAPWEEAIRREYTGYLMQACRDCTPPPPFTNKLESSPELQKTCFGYVMECERLFNESHRQREDYDRGYDCVMTPENCDRSERISRENSLQRMRANTHAASSSPSYPSPSTSPSYQPDASCFDRIHECKDQFEAGRFGYEEGFKCLFEPRNCAPWEEDFRREWINYMKQGCASCTTPSYFTNKPEMSPDLQETCEGYLKECQRLFNESKHQQEDYEMAYKCVNTPKDCDEEQEHFRANLISDIQMMCPSCTSPIPEPSSSPSPSSGVSCNDYIHECKARFDAGKLDAEGSYNCLLGSRNCDPSEEKTRQEWMSFLKSMCPSCGEASHSSPSTSPSYPPSPHPNTVSCYDHVMECKMHYENMEYEGDLEDLYECINTPSNCAGWEEKHRRIIFEDMIKPACNDCIMPSPPNTPGFSPENQKTCYGYLMECWRFHNESKQQYADLLEFNNCLHTPQNCLPWERDWQIGLYNGIKPYCPACTSPSPNNPKPSSSPSYPPSPSPSSNSSVVSCNDYIHECKARYDAGQLDNAGGYNCILTPRNCAPWEEETRQEWISYLKSGCASCTSPAPYTNKPGSSPDHQKTCNGYLKECHRLFNESKQQMADYERAYSCASTPKDCDSAEEGYRDYLLSGIKMMCPSCGADKTSPATVPFRPTRTPKPGDGSCYDHIMHCWWQFNQTAQQLKELEVFHTCIYEPTNCADWEEGVREKTASDIKLYCYTCTTPSMKPNVPEKSPELQKTCFGYVMECWRIFNESARQTPEMIAFNGCMHKPQNCQGWETGVRMGLYWGLKPYCPACTTPSPDNGPSSPSTPQPTKPSQVKTSCLDFLENCGHKFYATHQTPTDISNFYNCVYVPKNCAPWEEKHRKETAAAIKTYCPQCTHPGSYNNMPESTPGLQRTCYGYIMECWRFLNESRQQPDDLMTAHSCIHYPQNCDDEEEGFRKELNDGLVPYCPSCTSPAPKRRVDSCFDHINDCLGAFEKTAKGLRDVADLSDCIHEPRNCAPWEVAHQQDIVGRIKPYCGLCSSHAPFTHMPRGPDDQRTCYGYLMECWRNFNESNQQSRDLEEVHGCIHKPMNCDDGEEQFRNDLNAGIVPYCPTCTSPTPIVCYDYINECWKTYNDSGKSIDEAKTFLSCIQAPSNCQPSGEELRWRLKSGIEKYISDKEGAEATTPAPSCFGFLRSCSDRYEGSKKTYNDAKTKHDCLTRARDCKVWEEDHQKMLLEGILREMKKKCPECHGIYPSTTRNPQAAVEGSCESHFEMCRQMYEKSDGDLRDLYRYDKCIEAAEGCTVAEETQRAQLFTAIEEAMDTYDDGNGAISKQAPSALLLLITFIGIMLKS